MRHLSRILIAIFAAALIGGGPASAQVCRYKHIEGMGPRIDQIHQMLGADTTDPSKIKIYISRDNGMLYLQSNFRSADPDNPGAYSEFATKLRDKDNQLESLEQSLLNIIFWSGDEGPPIGAHEQAAAALRTTEVFIDPGILDEGGRPPFDLTGVKSITLATDRMTFATGKIESLRLDKPPPALIERLSGCCLSGRPPGKGVQIRAALRDRPIDPESTTLFSMVVDSATTLAIDQSATLKKMAGKVGADAKAAWSDKLDAALKSSAGKTLIVLAHVSNGKVVVESSSGAVQFEIGLTEFHSRAAEANVNLVLLGCETARDLKAQRVPVGIIGKYNTVFAVKQIDRAMQTSRNAHDFLDTVAVEGLEIVLQQGNWSQKGVGAAAYAKPSKPDGVLRRLFRLWFMGRDNG